MKRGVGFGGLFVLGLVAASGVSAGIAASTGTTTTGTTTEPATIADGVTIGGVPVGGATGDEAFDTVDAAFAQPLPLLVTGHMVLPTPDQLGASALVKTAVDYALAAAPGTDVKLRVKLNRPKAESYVASLAKKYDRKPVNATLSLRSLRPWIHGQKQGWALRRMPALASIFDALVANSRDPVKLRVRALLPKVTPMIVGPVIVIRRGSNRLDLYVGMRHWRAVRRGHGPVRLPDAARALVGRGQVAQPVVVPAEVALGGRCEADSARAGNPLGTRWMGLSASAVGIHGTPDDTSIGYSASHGCIRMHIRDAEWLFNRVRIGTTVFIVSA